MQVSCINTVNAGLGCGVGEQDEMKDNLITRGVWGALREEKQGQPHWGGVEGRTGQF